MDTDYCDKWRAVDLAPGGVLLFDVYSNLAVWFDATREVGGRLLDDAAYALTASNNVILSGSGARAGFDGAGTVTYTGTVSGNGTLVKRGSGDAGAQAFYAGARERVL